MPFSVPCHVKWKNMVNKFAKRATFVVCGACGLRKHHNIENSRIYCSYALCDVGVWAKTNKNTKFIKTKVKICEASEIWNQTKIRTRENEINEQKSNFQAWKLYFGKSTLITYYQSLYIDAPTHNRFVNDRNRSRTEFVNEMRLNNNMNQKYLDEQERN